MTIIDTKHIDFQSRQVIRALASGGVFGEDIYGILGTEFIVKVSGHSVSLDGAEELTFSYPTTDSKVIVATKVVDNSAAIISVEVLPFKPEVPNPDIDYAKIEAWVNFKISCNMIELNAKAIELAHVLREHNVFEYLDADLEEESFIGMLKQYALDLPNQDLHIVYEKSGVQIYLKTKLTENNVAIISEFKGYPTMWASPTVNIKKLEQDVNRIIAE